MKDIFCDVAIIGAGTAGLAAERAAREVGAGTILIDDRFAGTTCATVGCMPFKLLLAAANAAHNVRKASTFGIQASSPIIDSSAVMERVRKERDSFVADTLEAIEHIPPDNRVKGKARFIDLTTLMLDDGRKIVAKAVVICTGARPSVPKIFSSLGELLLTNESIFELRSLPRSVAVVGAGPLGLELAQALARLGVDITVFEQSDHLAGLRDAEVAKELKAILETDFPLCLGVKLDAARVGDQVRVTWSVPSAGTKSFDRILVAAGRPPELHHLNLPAIGIATDERGVPNFDKTTLQCGSAPLFIAGDVDGDRPVLHEASLGGAIAGGNAAAFPEVQPQKRTTPLAIMFTDPPLATIGAPPSERTIAGTGRYADQGRAKIEACAAGVVQIYADRETGAITGAVLLGPGMDHIAHADSGDCGQVFRLIADSDSD
jgi:dihydrolipoamide dehydrogenase